MDVRELHDIEQKIQHAFPELKVLTPMALLKEGNDNFVLETNNGLVFRIARNQSAQEKNERSSQLLLGLAGCIEGYKMPYPKFYKESSDDFPYGITGYEKIEGKDLSHSPAWIMQDYDVGLAQQIAEFLLQLHRVDISKVFGKMGLPCTPSPKKILNDAWPEVSDFLKEHLTEGEYGILKEWKAESDEFCPIPGIIDKRRREGSEVKGIGSNGEHTQAVHSRVQAQSRTRKPAT